MRYGCIGERLGHSFSREIHALLGDGDYRLVELAPEELAEFFRRRDFSGINVTIPYKEKIIPYLDEIDEAAERIGAVNTVVERDGRLYGYNTDFYGMSRLIEHIGIVLSGKKVAILGTGGTSRTAYAVAKHLGAEEILRVSRRAAGGAIDYATLAVAHADIDIVINTTPVGMYPSCDASPIELDAFPRLSGVVDAVYNPLRTRLVLDAKKRGIAAEGGLYMLVAQAIRARELFLNTVFSEDVCEGVYRKMLAAKESIALIGMPSSGKSTVGAILSANLNRPFVDTDTLIEEKIQMPISEYIKAYGEEPFRQIEKEVVKAVGSSMGAKVIATGGGVVLNRENVNNLLQNSRIYFLDRPLELLMPTEDRPLSSTKEALARRYHERYEIYKAAADVSVFAEGSAEGIAKLIEEEFLK